MCFESARAAGFTSPAAAVVGVGGAGGVVPGMDTITHIGYLLSGGYCSY